ncbi:MAG: beta strand repeat-containing protein, partial [Pseudobdellovibrionaceae bacterium]
MALNESPQTFTLDGKLYRTGTTTVLAESGIRLKIQILNPNKNCVLYEEEQTVNTSSTQGYFNIQVGSSVGSSKRTSNDPGSTMNQVFQNLTVITGTDVPSQTCTGSSYTPAAGDVRYFRITVTPSSTNVADILSPDMLLNSVPQAIVAQSLQGLEKSNVLQVKNSGSTVLTQANLEAAFTTPAYTNLQSILAGNFLKTDTTGANLPSFASNPSGLAAGDLWYDSTSNSVKFYNGSTVQTIGTSGSGIASLTVGSSMSADGSVGGSLTSSGTIDLSNTGVAAGTYPKVTVDIKGRVSAGASLDQTDIPTLTTAGKVSGDAIITGSISGDTSINTTGNLVSSGTVSGQTVQATQLRIYNGANYVQFTSPALSGNVLFTLPDNDGGNGDILQSNGIGGLSWVSPTAGFGSQTARTVLAAPQGANGAPTFRLLNITDIRSTAVGNGAFLTGAACGAGAALTYDSVSDTITCTVIVPTVTNASTLAQGKIWVGDGSNKAQAVTISGDASISTDGTLALKNVGTAGTYTKVTTDAQGRVTSGTNLVSADVTTALGYTPVNKAGDTMAGALNMGGYDITNVGNIELAASKHLLLSQHAADPSTAGWGAAEKGRTWYNTTSNSIKYWNGSAVQALGLASSGLTSLGGQTGQTQTLAISVDNSVATPTITSGSDAHTWKIPMALTTGVTAGLISKTEYDTFNAKLGTTTAFSGDVTGTYDNTSVDKIKGKALSPAAYASGQVLRYNGTNWVNTTLDFSDLSNKPTTLAGYGITDAMSSSLASGKILVGNASGDATAVTVSGDATINNAGILALDTTGVSAGTYTKVTVDTKGRVTVGGNIISGDVTTALGYVPLNKAGDSMTGVFGLYQTSSDPSTAGWGASEKGRAWFNTTSNQVKYWDGSAVQALGVASAGLTSLGGQTGQTQTFAYSIDNSVVQPQITSATDVHTLKYPMASNTGTTAGLISKAEYDTFNNKLGTTTNFSGDVTGTYDNNSVDKIKGKAVTAASATNQLMIYDGTAWVNSIVSGDATITSAGTLTLDTTGVSAGTYSKVQVDAKGRVLVGSQITSADVTTALGYTPTTAALNDGQIFVGNVSNVASPVTLSGDATLSNAGILSLISTGVSTGTFGSATAVPSFTVDAKGRITVAGSQAYADATAVSKGIVQTGANITNSSGVISVTSTDVTNALGFTPLNKAGDSMLGTLGLYQTSSDPSTAGWNGTQKGFTWFNTTSNEVKYWDGSAVKVLGVAGSGVQSINGQSGNAQTIAVSTDNSVVLPTITAGSDTITLKIPFASNTGTTAGLLSKADYDSFNAKLGTASAFSGDVSGTYNATSVDMIKGKAVSAASATNQIMIYDGSAWVNSTVSGDATITSAGTLTLDTTGVSAGTYTKVQVDAKGRVLAASQINSTDVTTALGYTPTTAALNDGQIFVGNASNVATAVIMSGDATLSNAGLLSLISTGVSTGTFGSATAVPSFTVDSKGRITVAGSQAYADATAVSKGIVQTGANITNSSGVISVTSTDVTNALGYTPVNKAGDTMAGAINMGGYDITNVGNIELAASKHLLLSQHGSDPSTAGWGNAEKGRTWFNTTANAIKYWNGSAVQTLGVASSGLTSLGGQTGQTQTLAISVDNSVATPTITS